MVGEVGIEPTQRKAKDLQSSPALQLRRSPKNTHITKAPVPGTQIRVGSVS